MKEYGSDFHYLDNYHSKHTHLTDVYHNTILMANGRQCIVTLIQQYQWQRIWMPEYFCHEVTQTIVMQTSIKIVYYPDWPGNDDKKIIESLPYQQGDVLFRMNYFGMRGFRSNINIPVPVIEDHSHDLLGHWALYSDAEWCIASLRKSLPIPEGGMLWSPKRYRIDIDISSSKDNEEIAQIRWEAMLMKSDYLADKINDKNEFRKKYVETEEWFIQLEPSLIDERSRNYIENININAWNRAKRKNWKKLSQLVKTETLFPENIDCTPFTFIILADDKENRDHIKTRLIEKNVYPAILWDIHEATNAKVLDFSQRILSIHCDGRYTKFDMQQLAAIINDSILL